MAHNDSPSKSDPADSLRSSSDDVGCGRPHHRLRLGFRRRLTDHDEVVLALEYRPQPLAQDRVVVDEHQTYRLGGHVPTLIFNRLLLFGESCDDPYPADPGPADVEGAAVLPRACRHVRQSAVVPVDVGRSAIRSIRRSLSGSPVPSSAIDSDDRGGPVRQPDDGAGCVAVHRPC